MIARMSDYLYTHPYTARVFAGSSMQGELEHIRLVWSWTALPNGASITAIGADAMLACPVGSRDRAVCATDLVYDEAAALALRQRNHHGLVREGREQLLLSLERAHRRGRSRMHDDGVAIPSIQAAPPRDF